MTKDAELKEKVESELEFEPRIDAAHVGVSVTKGVATLTGTVASLRAKEAAEEAARRVRGIRGVVEELEVELEPADLREDEEIVRNVLDGLKWHVDVPEERIQVTVEDGEVRLTGSVKRLFQKRAAERVARSQVGVRDVWNEVEVTDVQPEDALKSEIEQALEREFGVEAEQIAVEVDDGEVRLEGSVRTWRDREAAMDAALRAPGVFQVEAKLATEEDEPEG